MGSAEKVSWKRVLILAGAIIAFTIGSGFATGQEIIQYYTAYGAKGLLIILILQKQELSKSLKREMTYINISVANMSEHFVIITPHYSATCPSS